MLRWYYLSVVLLFFCASCRNHPAAAAPVASIDTIRKKAICCESNLPARFAPAMAPSSPALSKPGAGGHAGMVWIAGGSFMMGADNRQAAEDEYPKHKVTVDGFWMDATEVTNAQFAQFVKATGYITTAERKPDWNELKKQLPPGTARPSEDLLVAASLVFS